MIAETTDCTITAAVLADNMATPFGRERMALRGIRLTGHIVREHIAGQKRADLFIASLLHSSARGDELLDFVLDLAERARTHEGKAHCRGLCRAIQKRLEKVAP